MATVRVNDISLEYRWWGTASSRPPVLLLHEALGSVKTWGPFAARLADATERQVYAYSRQGHGASEPLAGALPKDYLVREALEVVPALRAALGLDEVVLVGLQEGATIALVHAGGAEQAPLGVAAISPFLFSEPALKQSVRGMMKQFERSGLREQLGESAGNPEATFWYWSRLWSSKHLDTWNVDDFLRGVPCPILAVRGEQDTFTTAAHVERLRGLAHLVQPVSIPGCRQLPHVERPAMLVTSLLAFIKRVSA